MSELTQAQQAIYDDVILLNHRLTNGDADSIIQRFLHCTGLVHRNAVFDTYAVNAICALTFALVDKRDNFNLILNIESLRHYFTAEKMIELTTDSEVSEPLQEKLKEFLRLIGWDENKVVSDQSMGFHQAFVQTKSLFGLTLATLSEVAGQS
jgi:hypothetical protein